MGEMRLMSFEGKNAIVTGAGSGMGQAIAWALAREGMTVLAVGRSEDKLVQTARKSPAPDKIIPVSLDVGDRDKVTSTVADFESKHGAIDLLVNNAGMNVRERATDVLTGESFDRIIRTNLTGVFNMTAAVVGGMRQRKSGTIIAISSIAGNRPLPLAGPAYSASKFGVNGFMGTVAREVAPDGVRVSIICPGEVATPILDERPVPVPESERAKMVQPRDIAEAVLFIYRLPPQVHVPDLVMKPLGQDYG